VQTQYRNVTTAGALKTPSTRDYSAAAFMVEEWERGVMHLQAGLRYDWSRIEPRETDASVTVNGVEIPSRPREFGSVSGALGALLHASQAVQVGASVSRAFRIPDFNELYSDGPHLAAYSYDVGNPRIGQETGLGMDLFARVSHSGLRAEGAVFRNRMHGFIFPRNTGEIGPQGGRPKFQYVGKNAVLWGGEGGFEWNFAPRLVLDGNVSYVVGRLSETPDSIPAIDEEPARAGSPHLPLMPPLNGTIGLRYETGNLFFGVDSKIAASQERLGDFETVTDGYALLNAVVGVRIEAGGRLNSITLRLGNLANKEYRDHLSRVKSIMPEAGRSVSLLYKVSF
jgi:iron complex outermembrane receptor protein